MESTIEQLSKIDFLEIYEEIAQIPITNEQVVKMCITMPCKVDLRKVNLVYLVEEKYKDKLSTYKKSKILKWLHVNLPRFLPNPEAKYLRWHERHQRKEKIEWIKRKTQAIQQLPEPISGSQDFEDVVEKETSGCPTDNSPTSTLGTTVIPSQPKSPQQVIKGFSDLLDASGTENSYELPTPTLFSNTVSSTQGNCPELMASHIGSNEKNEKLLPRVVRKKIIFPQSEDFCSQDDAYSSFSLDNMVTSTQEFG